MGFFGALYTGTAGLLAQERATSHVSENIANMSTVGYKRMDTAFHELVSTGKNNVSSHNSVAATRVNRITKPGGVQQTSSSSDLAIIGGGFFAVKEDVTNPDSPFLFTRNGSFSQDNQGILRNSAGFALYGWPIVGGSVASSPDTAGLQPIDVDLLQNTSLPTTRASLYMNLDSNAPQVNPHKFSPPQQLPVNGIAPADFTRGITVYDTNGTERRLNVELRAITGPMAHFSSNTNASTGGMERTDIMAGNATGPTPNIVDGDTLHISDGTNTLDITFRAGAADPLLGEVQTVSEMLSLINNYTGAGTDPLFTATLDGDGQLLVQANDPTVTLDLTETDVTGLLPPTGTILGAGGLNIIEDPDAPGDYTYEPDADIAADGVANPNQSAFPGFANSTNPNPFHWWEMRITINDPNTPNDSTNQVELSKGLINFNGDGSLNAVTNANDEALIDLGSINFDAADPSGDTAITFDMSQFTQYGSAYEIIDEAQNGTGLGTFKGIEISRDGTVQSLFTNGQRVDTYKIPLANFANANGLERISGTAFAVTADSGDPTMYDSGIGGTGVMNASSVETSNVDVANEFSLLIIGQRAFSMNSRVITTVDEMTENLAQLKR